MKPSSQKHAEDLIRTFMLKKIVGRDSKVKKTIIKDYCRIANIIYVRWHIGVENYRAKHLRWFLHVACSDLAPGTQYRYWRRVEEIIVALAYYEKWEPHLRGSWRSSTGKPFAPTKRGRPPKPILSRANAREFAAKSGG